MRCKITSYLTIIVLFLCTGCVIYTKSGNSQATTRLTEIPSLKLPNKTPIIKSSSGPTAVWEKGNQYDIIWSAPKDCQLDQLSPDGRWVTYLCLGSQTGRPNEMWLQQVGVATPPIFLSNDVHSTWSPNSDSVITYFLESINIFSLSDLTHEKKLTGIRSLGPLKWSPNGDMILVERADADSLLSVIYLDGTIKTILTDSDFFVPPKMMLESKWLPNNRHIYWGWRSSWVAQEESSKQIWKIDIQSKDRELILETTENIDVNNIEILSANRLQLGDYLFDIENNHLIFSPLPFQAKSRRSYAKSHDGQFIAHWNERTGKELRLYTQEGNSTPLIELTDGSESRRVLRWEKDGSGIWVIIDEFGTATGHEKLAFIPTSLQSVP